MSKYQAGRVHHLAPRADNFPKKPCVASVLEELAYVRICVLVCLKVDLYPIQRL